MTTEAGAHPNVTTAFALNVNQVDEPATLPAYPKDVGFELPRGFVGNTMGVARCNLQHLREEEEKDFELNPTPCPQDTVVGMAIATITEGHGSAERVSTAVEPVYNIAPVAGEAAAFAFFEGPFGVRLDTRVLSNGNYAVRTESINTSQEKQALAVSITIWGVPSAHSGRGDDRTREDAQEAGVIAYLDGQEGVTFGGSNGINQTAHALLSNPTQCSQDMEALLSTDSWAEPGVLVTPPEGAVDLGVPSGCASLPFQPTFSMAPDNSKAGEPAGYEVQIGVPQNEGPEEQATSDLKDATTTLPVGTVVDPSAANGLKACSPAQFYGPHHGEQSPATAGECPNESEIGGVEITAPALSEPLRGDVYLGEPECDPCSSADAASGKMVRLFVEAHDEGEEGERVLVKLEGHGSINQANGQITTTFANQPQVPFSHLKLDLTGGPNAALANPRTCGTYAATMSATPWSETGTITRESSPFEVNSGCFGAQFKPSFAAGTQNNQAGGFSSFTLGLTREDVDQYLGGVQTTLPPGLLGLLAKVPLCGEAQANEGTCPESSQVGTTTALVGPGGQPYEIGGGKVYLTGPYGGAPFGLSIVVPAVAGPYTLAGLNGAGEPADHGTVVVRAKISVNPHTAQVSVDSNPLPTTLDGIPLQIRQVQVNVNREGFIFNPTNCSKMAVEGTISSSEGMSEKVSSPFEAANCATLPFQPEFKVYTHAGHTRRNGAYLRVSVGYRSGNADIKSVFVELPKVLPSREETLKAACSLAQFEADPAGCPAASKVGTAVVHTPVLNDPLSGPAILVSHGGAAFPDLVMVLQGQGVTFDLEGSTNIVKGITSSDFKSVPDVPVSEFELTLPEKKNALLAATANLCYQTVTKRVKVKVHGKTVYRKKHVKSRRTLTMPTTITGQNGAVLKQATKITVEGCGKAKG